MSDINKLLEWQRVNSRYYLRLGDNPELEVTEAEFIAAERAAGFFPKTGCGPLATAGFGSNHVLGRIESPAFKDYPRLANLERAVIEQAMKWGETGGAGGAASLEQPLLTAVDALLRGREGQP